MFYSYVSLPEGNPRGKPNMELQEEAIHRTIAQDTSKVRTTKIINHNPKNPSCLVAPWYNHPKFRVFGTTIIHLC